jgi:hypothetical protein
MNLATIKYNDRVVSFAFKVSIRSAYLDHSKEISVKCMSRAEHRSILVKRGKCMKKAKFGARFIKKE